MKPNWVIAVSGHRSVTPSASLSAAIQKACELTRSTYPNHSFDIVSCLAEGADRLLTIEITRILAASYAVVLPFSPEEYKKDFHSVASVEQFEALIAGSRCALRPERAYQRPAAYDIANEKMLSSANMLIVIWDGQPSRGVGGTGAVVARARAINMPMIWLRLENGDVVEVITERLKGGADE